MIKRIKSILKKRKAKVFFFFLCCSTAIWFISSLNQDYVGTAAFDLQYVNYPDGYLYKGASKKKMDVKLRAGGFNFLGFNFKNKRVQIDVSEAEKEGERFFVPETMYREQIEKQLTGTMALLEIDNDTLFLDMLAVTTKKVPVRPRAQMNLAENYLLDGKIRLAPDSISITGPSQEIDTMVEVRTQQITLPDLASDFSEEVALFKSPKLNNTSYSESTAILTGKVARFSERILELPIQVLNLPEGVEIKTFPAKVKVVCKAKTGLLKSVKASDFQVVGDYAETDNGASKELPLKLQKKPEGMTGAKLTLTEVEYIVKKD